MRINPHLVLDGAVAAAAAVGARRDHGRASAAEQPARMRASPLRSASAPESGRREHIELVAVPDRFVAGEESALVHWLNGGPAKPTFVAAAPLRARRPRAPDARPERRDARQHRADRPPRRRLVPRARHRRRARLDARHPGRRSRAARHHGAGVRRPAARPRSNAATGSTRRRRRILIGGYFGTWVPAAAALGASLSEAALRPLGASLGARSITVLPHTSCGVVETARLAAYLAGESAGQCGPCVFGLPRDRRRDQLDRGLRRRLRATRSSACRRIAPQVTGRGACAHPNGATRLVASALTRLRGRDQASPRRPLHGALVRAGDADPAGVGGVAMSRPTSHLRVNPIRCDAYGHCAELLPS